MHVTQTEIGTAARSGAASTEPKGTAPGRILRIRVRTVVLATLLIAALGVVFITADFFGWPERQGPRSVSDRAGIVTVAIPAGWTDVTERSARQIEFDGSGDPFTTPDIELDKYDPENDDRFSASVSVYLQVAPYDTLSAAELHRIAVLQRSDLAVDATTVRRSETADGWPALSSNFGEGGGELTTVTTIRSDHYLVTVVQQISRFGDPTVAEIDGILDGMRING